MIDPTPQETAAMQAAIHPMADYIGAEIGFDKPLRDYTSPQILTLIEVIVTAYHDALSASAHAQWPDATIPYDPAKRMGAIK